MLPKSHKSRKVNEIIEIERTEYIKIGEDIFIEGWPIVASLVFQTSEISKIFHGILKQALSLISHFVKNSFNFTQRLEKQYPRNALLSTCNTKIIYINIRHDLFLGAIECRISYKRTDFYFHLLRNNFVQKADQYY